MFILYFYLHKANSCIVQQSPFRNPQRSNLDTAERNHGGKTISNSTQIKGIQD